VNRFFTDSSAFLVPVLLKTPQWLEPYNYVVDRPTMEIDPYGLGPLQLIKCLYYGSKVADAGKQCQGECPKSYEGTIKFIQQYATNGSLETAMLNCTCKKVGPDVCDKWLANCFAAPIMQGPKP
jgi:hypothetical protein